MTLRETAALVDAYSEHERIENYRAGLPASILANIHSKKGSKKFQPLDFFGPQQQARRRPDGEALKHRLLQFGFAMAQRNRT